MGYETTEMKVDRLERYQRDTEDKLSKLEYKFEQLTARVRKLEIALEEKEDDNG